MNAQTPMHLKLLEEPTTQARLPGLFLHVTEKTMVGAAAAYAAHYHALIDQRRKWSGEPYINHPAMVAALVESVAHTRAMVAASWLHDTVEDTSATAEEILEIFGAEVAGLVAELTKSTTLMSGSRSQRHRIELERAAAMSPAAQTIKLADIIDNCRGVAQLNSDFAKIYIPERFDFLAVLTEGDKQLWQMAADTLNDAADAIAQGAAHV